MITPAWFTWAKTRIGVKEIVGAAHNPIVLDFWKLGKVALDVRDDETAWCAAFANAALEVTGYRGTRSGRARSFAESPLFKPCDMRVGSILVFSSSAGPNNGHVGFVESVTDTHANVVGGNQGNAVSTAPFPLSRIVANVWPVAAPQFKNYPLAHNTRVGGKEVSDR